MDFPSFQPHLDAIIHTDISVRSIAFFNSDDLIVETRDADLKVT